AVAAAASESPAQVTSDSSVAAAPASAEPQVTEPVAQPELSAPREPEIDVRPVLVAGVREIAGEVRNSLEFHRSQDGGGEVSTVVLSGAALQIAGFADALRAELTVPVLVQTVDLGDAAAASSVAAERLAVAAGLAIEELAR